MIRNRTKAKSSPSGPSPVDTRLRVIAVALEPALALARISALPLDDLQELVAVGYFRDLRARGMTLEAIARRIRKSLRTVAGLSRRASSDAAAVGASERLRAWRKLAAHLAAHGRSSPAKLRRVVPSLSSRELDAELARMELEGVVNRDRQGVVLSAQLMSLISDDIDKRIDSVRHFLDAVSQVIYRRFWAEGSDAEAFARVLSFRVDRQLLARLRERQYEALRTAVIEADRDAGESAVNASVAVCFVERAAALPWTPEG